MFGRKTIAVVQQFFGNLFVGDGFVGNLYFCVEIGILKVYPVPLSEPGFIFAQFCMFRIFELIG